MAEELKSLYQTYSKNGGVGTLEEFIQAKDELGEESFNTYVADYVPDLKKKDQPTENGNPSLTTGTPPSQTDLPILTNPIPENEFMVPLGSEQDLSSPSLGITAEMPSTDLPSTETASSGLENSNVTLPTVTQPALSNVGNTVLPTIQKPKTPLDVLAGKSNDTQVDTAMPSNPAEINADASENNFEANQLKIDAQKSSSDFIDQYKNKDYIDAEKKFAVQPFDTYGLSDNNQQDIVALEKSGVVEIQRDESGNPILEGDQYRYKYVDKNYYDNTYVPYIDKLQREYKSQAQEQNIDSARFNFGNVGNEPAQDGFGEFASQASKFGVLPTTEEYANLTTTEQRNEYLANLEATQNAQKNGTTFQEEYDKVIPKYALTEQVKIANGFEASNLLLGNSKWDVIKDAGEIALFENYFKDKNNVLDFGEYWSNEGKGKFGSSTIQEMQAKDQTVRAEIWNDYLSYRNDKLGTNMRFIEEAITNASTLADKYTLSGDIVLAQKEIDKVRSLSEQYSNNEAGMIAISNLYSESNKNFTQYNKQKEQEAEFQRKVDEGKLGANTQNILGQVVLGIESSIKSAVGGVARFASVPFGDGNVKDAVDIFSDKELQIGNVKIAPLSQKVVEFKGDDGLNYKEVNGTTYQSDNGKLVKTNYQRKYSDKVTKEDTEYNWGGLTFMASKAFADIYITRRIEGGINKAIASTADRVATSKKVASVFGEASQMAKVSANFARLPRNASGASVKGWTVQMFDDSYKAGEDGGIKGDLNKFLYGLTIAGGQAILQRINPDINFIKSVNSEARQITEALMVGKTKTALDLLKDFGGVSYRVGKKALNNTLKETPEEFSQQGFQDIVNLFLNNNSETELQTTDKQGYKDLFVGTVGTSIILSLVGSGSNDVVKINNKEVNLKEYSRNDLVTEIARDKNGLDIITNFKNEAYFQSQKDSAKDLESEILTRSKFISKVPEVDKYSTPALSEVAPILQQIEKKKEDLKKDDGTFAERINKDIAELTTQANAILDNDLNTNNESPNAETAQPTPQSETVQEQTTETQQSEVATQSEQPTVTGEQDVPSELNPTQDGQTPVQITRRGSQTEENVQPSDQTGQDTANQLPEMGQGIAQSENATQEVAPQEEINEDDIVLADDTLDLINSLTDETSPSDNIGTDGNSEPSIDSVQQSEQGGKENPQAVSATTDTGGSEGNVEVRKFNSREDIRNEFKRLTGDEIKTAELKLAGISLRNNMREAGNGEGDQESNPYTNEQLALIDLYNSFGKKSQHLYHTTKLENISSIKKEGLVVGKKARYEGVSSSSKISFAGNEAIAKYYGSNNDVLLRVKKGYKLNDLEPDLLGGGEGAYVTGENIPPDALEIKVKNKWIPLTDSVQSTTPFSDNEQAQTLNENTEEFPTANGKYTVQKKGNTFELIDNKTGKPAKVSDKTKDGYFLEIAKSKEYPTTEIPQGLEKQSDYESLIVSDSNNPKEIAGILITMPKYQNVEGTRESFIANNINRVSRQSFVDFSDENNISMGFAQAYFAEKGKETNSSKIDVIASNASLEMTGDTDSDVITPEEVVRFMLDNRKGSQSYFRQPNPDYLTAVNKFVSLTGVNPTPKNLNSLLGDAYNEESAAKVKEQAEKRYEQASNETRNKLENEYNEYFNSLSIEEQELELQKTYPNEIITETENQSEPSKQEGQGNANDADKSRTSQKTTKSPEYQQLLKDRTAQEARVKAAKEKLDRVSRNTNQNFQADQENIFGERPQAEGMFDERADGNAGKNIIAEAKAEHDRERAELTRINNAIRDFESGNASGTGAIDFQSTDKTFTPIPQSTYDKLVKRLLGVFKKFGGKVITTKAEVDAKLKEFGVADYMIKAFHGSPYRFDKFSTDKMGSGEGAQAFGWGLYFTDVKSIAENYANKLGRVTTTKDIRGEEIAFTALYDVEEEGSIDKAIQLAQNRLDDTEKNKPYNEERNNEIIKGQQSIIDFLNRNRDFIKIEKNIYEVSIHNGKTPEQYSWLEWDKPIKENTLNKIEEYFKSKYGIYIGLDEGEIGKNIYDYLEDELGSKKEASNFLLESGIDGVKYPAESISRGATSDNARGFNYVVFDENAVTIEEVVEFMKTKDGEIYGAKFPDGTIYLNPEKVNANTPIHEFSHLWQQLMPTRFKKGVELLKNTPIGKKTFAELKGNEGYANKSDEELWNEALVTVMGNEGERIFNSSKSSKLKEWLTDLFKALGNAFGIRDLSPNDNLSVFVKGALKEVMGDREIFAENSLQGQGSVDFQIPALEKPKNLMPKYLINGIADAIRNGGKSTEVMNIVNNSNWFKGLGESTKSNLTFNDVKSSLIDSDNFHRENDKVKAKERMDKSKAEAEAEKAKQDEKLAKANPLKADDKIIYTNDKPRNKFIAWKEKWFSNEGGILKPVMNFQDKATGKTNLEIRFAKDLIARLSAEAKKSNFYTEADWTNFDTALRGEKGSVQAYNELPDTIKPFVNEMRMKIDGLSEFLVENDLVTPSQAVTIEENKGQYVSRAYEFFESKDSVGKIFRRIFSNGNISKQFDEAKWNDAVTVYQQNVLNGIATDGSGKYTNWTDAEKQAFARKEGQRLLEAYILELSSDYNQAKSTKGANVDVLKERKDVPVEIRRLLGEYTDPRVAYGVTIAKMSQMAYQRKFLQQVRDIGMGTLFFKEGDPNIPSTHTVKIASDSNQAYSPLSGLYTTPEFKDVFLDVAEPQTKDWINLWIKATGGFKYGKTILSPMTQAVNFTANFGFLTMNGLYDIRGFAAGAKVFADEIRVSKKNDPFVQELIEENVIGQNIQLNEIENDFHKNIEKTIINDIKRAPLTKNILGYTVMLPQKVYKASDDFFKAYAYFQETNDYAKSIYGKPYKELIGEERARVRALASEVVKNTLANYDRKYKAADVVRKGTRNLLGNFLSFQAESIRTLINATQIGLRDIKNPETRSVGLRRLAGVMAYNATYAVITSYLGKLAGIGLTGLLSALNDDDEEEKNKKLNDIVAPWARSTEKTFRFEKDGTLTYFTYGNINPYGITYRVMNAYKNGTDNTNKGGAMAMFGELTEPFVSTEMSVKWLINVYAGKNDYGKELVGQQDYIDYTINKLSPTFIKLWKDNSDGTKNNDFEMINIVGIKKYNIDLTDQLNFRFSDYQKKINDIGKEIYGLQYKVADGKMSPEEAEVKHKELIEKQKKMTDDFIPIMEAHVSFGAKLDGKGGVLDKGNKTYLNVFNSSRDWMPYLLAPEEVRKGMEKKLNK